jgi:nitrite reductase/ring-hydroxylating ferredoxin subunit
VPEGELKPFSLRGVEILVVNRNGQFYCLEARCTHAGAPLAEGDLLDDVLKCPWHGSRFNIKNGVVLEGPARKSLQVYSSVIKGGYLFVEI